MYPELIILQNTRNFSGRSVGVFSFILSKEREI
jgi:hypothetical protein